MVNDIVLDDLPDEVRESLAARQRLRDELQAANPGFEFVVSDVDAWGPDAVLRVAFLGGDTALLTDIESTLRDIQQICSVRFQLRDAQGAFLRWTASDTDYRGQIRVSFDRSGYWSLVGRDSVDPAVSNQQGIGGGPNERSLNLGGFDASRPISWRGTVLHEFLHALGFHHEHQNVTGPCQGDFRWEDDPGYVPTKTAAGSYTVDPQGRRPGIYTYLSGPPNKWNRPKVDHNLRADPDADLRYGPFDRASVMLYRFDPLFYGSAQSTCRPDGDGQRLSAGDVTALRSLYPSSPAAMAALDIRKRDLVARLEALEPAGGLEAAVSRPDWVGRVRASMSPPM